MNSLVVFLSVMALAAAEPSAIIPGGLLGYSTVYGVGASAVSHQSRVDVKSTPTVVSTEIVQPIARTVVAQPAVVPSYVAPLAYQTPLAYSAPLALAPAAVSHQSRLDIKSSPAYVSTVAAAPVFRTVIPAPLGYPAINYPSINYPSILNSAAIAPVAIAGPAPAPVAAVQTEAQAEPAELPQAPSETPEVAAARAAHLEAKAEIEEAHKIEKRSLVVPAPVITSYATPITKYAAPVVYPGYPGYYSTYPAAPIVRYF